MRLPLTHALAWIVGSTLLISGGSYAGLKFYLKIQQKNNSDPQFVLRSIIQTGPQKEALKTDYLAELLGLSSDRSVRIQNFNLKAAKERLLGSPLISAAQVKIVKPSTLYIDYTIRQPIAYLEDYKNVAIDKEGYVFPFAPYFSPKNLPCIYLGLAPFGVSAQWGRPCPGPHMQLALEILKLVTNPKVSGFFSIKRIDVSNAFSDSYGTREIVVITEDFMTKQMGEKELQLCFPRILRLSTKFYAQELGNYLKLREQMLEEERLTFLIPEKRVGSFRMKEKIIDFRIPKLAFIE